MSKQFFLVHLYDDFSGSPKVLSQLVHLLIQHNQSVLTVTGCNSNGFISKSGAPNKSYFYKRCNNKVITLFFYIFSQLVLFIKMSFWLISSRIKKKHTVVVVNTLLPFGAAIAGRLFSNEMVYYSHEISIKPRLLYLILRWICEITSDHVIFVSNYLKKELNITREIPQTVIYNALPSEYSTINLCEDSLYRKWNDKIVLMVCSLKDYKGINEFIHFSRVSHQKKLQLRFIFIVNDTKSELDKYLFSKEYYSNVTFVCRPEELLSIYTKAFMVLNLSCRVNWIETFGLTLIEGMSAYCPVIAPLVGGPVEIVEEGSGFLIDSHDPVIIDVLNELSKDYNLWLKMALSAKSRSSSFSELEYKNKFLKLFGI